MPAPVSMTGTVALATALRMSEAPAAWNDDVQQSVQLEHLIYGSTICIFNQLQSISRHVCRCECLMQHLHNFTIGGQGKNARAGKRWPRLLRPTRTSGRSQRRVNVAGQNFERQRQKCIAGENGHRLAERLVAGRLAAAQVVVVHRRQVVVDQRISVHHFHRTSRGNCRPEFEPQASAANDTNIGRNRLPGANRL